MMSPDRLRECLPGCERFVATSPTTFEATLRLGVAFLKGTYKGELHVVDPVVPEQFRMEVVGGGSLGRLRASGTVRLVNAGSSGTVNSASEGASATGGGVAANAAYGPEQTYFFYEGEADVSGRVAAVGERVIEATANRLIGLFFDCVSSHVER
jgi:uncharacterized protein